MAIENCFVIMAISNQSFAGPLITEMVKAGTLSLPFGTSNKTRKERNIYIKMFSD